MSQTLATARPAAPTADAPTVTTPAAGPVPKAHVLAIAPYMPGKATGDDGRVLIKLSANENPLGCSPLARAAFAGAAGDLARYPDPGAAALRAAIAARLDLDPARIIYGTGSDDILHLACGAFAGEGDEVVYVRYGFQLYDIAARRVGATPVVADDADYGTDVDALLAAVTPRTRVMFVANPNNPTGTMASRDEIARLHAGLPDHVLLVLDQAYAEYLDDGEDDGGLDLARTASNVLVTRTFSKIHGLAAERVGWGYGPAAVIDAIHRIRAPFNVTICGQAAAIAAINDDAFVTQSRTHNAAWRGWLAGALAPLANSGVRILPSSTNFLFVLFEGALSAETAYKGLMDAGYIVRWLPGQGLPHALRITIGTADETRGVAAALRALAGADDTLPPEPAA